MLNRIIRFSLDNRLIVLLLSGIILVAGTILMLRTEVDIFPDLNAPTVTIMTEAPGLATEEVERLVTYPVEMAVSGSRGVENVRSSSTTGFSVVNVQFTDDTDPLVARQTIAERLSLVAEQLPKAAKTPVMGPQSSILGEVFIIGLTSDSLSMAELRTIADRHLSPALQSVEGVSQISVLGGEEREYQIVLDPGRMKQRGVTLAQVSEAVENLNDNAPGNVVNAFGNEYVVKADVSTTNLADLSATVIDIVDGDIVTLGDIAEVKTGVKSPRMGAASYCMKPAVLLTVTKQPHTGTINLTERLMHVIDTQKQSLPSTLVISTDIFSQRDFIDRSISNLGSSLFEGALMVIVVLFFFMMNVRATVVSVLALPMSIIITLLILHFMGISVNTMTLGGIAIAIGSLVDDAIVDVENVGKRLRENYALPEAERKKALTVVYEASKEVRTPIFNSSLIIVAGFMPLFFLSGVEGRMLMPLGIAFVVALAASTIVALTLTPVVSSFLLGTKKQQLALSKESVTMRKLKQWYGNGLQSVFRHRTALLVSVGLAFVFTVVLLFTMGRGFLPPFNEGSFTINISSLPGIALDESDRIGRKAEEIILSMPEISTVARKTGRAELDEHSLGTNVSEIEAPYKLDKRSRSELVSDLRKKLAVIPGVNIEIGQPISHRIDAMLSGTEAPIVYKIYGDDLDRLHQLAMQLSKEMNEVKGLEDVAVEQQVERPEIAVRPRRQLMARYGITPASFNDLVETLLGGKVVSTVYEDGFPRDLTLRFADGSSLDADRLGEILIDTEVGKVPLNQIAEIVMTSGPNSVNRENASRRIIVSANIEGRDLSSVVNEIDGKIHETIKLPEGYSIVRAGRAENAAAATARLVGASALAILLIVILLFYEFHSAKLSAIILVNMPLAMIGGVIILKLAGLELDIPAIIGFVALLGIATRNGMLLISRYESLVAEGVDRRTAVVKGSLDRLTPIIMTALSSALALIPLALRGEMPGNEIQSPLAIVILGGLATSTLLNLFVVPVLYLNLKKSRE